MEYKFYEKEKKMIIKGAKNFSPRHTFECGQCFRWAKEEDSSYTGIAFNKVINVKSVGNDIEISNTNVQEFKDIWFEYFDLGRDYDQIKKNVAKDEIMKKAIEFGSGIRLLKQDATEMYISFILSANNNIPRITNSINILSHKFGRKIIWEDREYYTFPSLTKISKATIEELEESRAGFRCKYIKQAAIDALKSNTFEGIGKYETTNARNELMKIKGIGPKVADCILLFSGTKYDVFPTDVWIKRIMEEIYFKKEVTMKEIQKFVDSYFGEYAGFAQQYLFYYARENKIGIK